MHYYYLSVFILVAHCIYSAIKTDLERTDIRSAIYCSYFHQKHELMASYETVDFARHFVAKLMLCDPLLLYPSSIKRLMTPRENP